jgi:predicted RNA-binding Zn ribbon-like protein
MDKPRLAPALPRTPEAAAPAGAPRGALGFRFGGRLSLDLVWTLAQRSWAPAELLATPHALAQWLVAAGLSDQPPAVGPEVLGQARLLREAIHSAVRARIAHTALSSDDVAVINQQARQPPLVPQLTADGHLARAAADPAAAALATIAWDAVDLLASADPGRLRECARPGCSLLFLDTSRPGHRQWCSMARCGSAVNTSRYRTRQ